MKIISSCWDQIHTSQCQYGAHFFDGSTAKIYINHWLCTSLDQEKLFYRRNDEGFVGHCLLVFKGVKVFDFSVITYHFDKNKKAIWHEPITNHYKGPATEATTSYKLEGSLHGFEASVEITIEAQQFELHILEKDEPARQS
jgi:hypothetical protein